MRRYRTFFVTLRGRECIVGYQAGNPGDWYAAPLEEDGSEGDAIYDLTDEEDAELWRRILDNEADMAYGDW
jgi:hypothetical protein